MTQLDSFGHQTANSNDLEIISNELVEISIDDVCIDGKKYILENLPDYDNYINFFKEKYEIDEDIEETLTNNYNEIIDKLNEILDKIKEVKINNGPFYYLKQFNKMLVDNNYELSEKLINIIEKIYNQKIY